ncbi:MAG: hypothetical protein IKR68_01670, partial [Lachnospiraceae bacterium]|nr:hypothetical protein [Lachnospiraceae bacterium]
MESYNEVKGVIYTSGSEPAFTWDYEGERNAWVRLEKIKPEKELQNFEVKGEFSLELTEGEYVLLPYIEDDTNDTVYYAPDYPVHIIYDRTGPGEMNFELATDCRAMVDNDRDDFQFFAADGVDIVAHPGNDEISGVEKIFMNCSGMEYETDRLSIKDGTVNISQVSAYCVDRCGNRSDTYVLSLPKIVIDRKGPEVKVDHEENDGNVIFMISQEDTGSG